jgi:hypothetical protein
MIVIKASHVRTLANGFLFARLLLAVINYHQNGLNRIINGKGETADFHQRLHLTFYHSPCAISILHGAARKATGKERAIMGVIGRLDDQVNEIIIKPVGARHRQESEETQRPTLEESAPPSQAEAADAPLRDEENATAQSQPELPVWLL